MNWKEYGYVGEWSSQGAVIYRPVVTIYLRYGDVCIPTTALVDSGSQGTVIHSDLARLLGIDPSQCRRANLTGSAGSADGFTCEVQYEVDGFPDETISTNAVFIDALPVSCLIGQYDFFDKFLVLFDKRNNVLKIAKPE